MRRIREIELEIDRLKDEVARLRDREFATADPVGAPRRRRGGYCGIHVESALG